MTTNEPPSLFENTHFEASTDHHRTDTPAKDANTNVLLDINSVSSFEQTERKGAFAVLFNKIIPYGGMVSNCFSVASVTLGGGIISMPSSFASSGIIMAIIYLVIVTIMSIYSMTLITYALKQTGCHTLEELGRVLMGRGVDHFVGVVIWVSCFGTAIGYISATSGLISAMAKNSSLFSEYWKTTSGNRLLTSIVWLLTMLPIVIPKRVNSIRYASTFACLMVPIFVVIVVAHSCTHGLKLGMRGDMAYFTSGNSAIYGLSVFVFAYMCQCPAPNIYYESRPKPSVRRFTWATAIALTLCMTLYILSGFFGYMDFGDDSKPNVLENFNPESDSYVLIGYIGMLLKLVAAYAMNMLPCRDYLYHALKWDLDTISYVRHSLCILIMSFGSLICGLFVPNVNLAFGLVGSLCGGFIGFIFPALFWMYCGNWSVHTVGIWHYLATYTLLFSGVVATVFGTIATIYSNFFE